MTKVPSGEPFLMQMGHHLRGLRTIRRISQVRVAKDGGLSPDTVRRIELGRMDPSITTLRRAARGLDLSLGSFFGSLECGTAGQPIEHQILDRLSARSHADRMVALALVIALLDSLDQQRG